MKIGAKYLPLLLGLPVQSYAEVPREITTELSESATDSATVAALVLSIVIAIAAFKYMKRAA